MSPESTKSTILYADDDPDDVELLKEAFNCLSKDIELIACRNGIEAMDYLNTLSHYDLAPCLIILDVNMPLLGGKEVLKRLRSMQRFKDTPAVIYTTSSQVADKIFAEEHNGFISKPMDSHQMAKIADQLIENCTEEIKRTFVR